MIRRPPRSTLFSLHDALPISRIENGADAHRDGVHRHVFPALEEARVVIDGLLGESLESGARAQRARRLIEGDVAVGDDAQDLQVDPAAFSSKFLIPFAEVVVDS